MKRSWLIAVLGVVLAVAAYFAFYYAGTARSRRLATDTQPELAWLKEEFHLSDAEFARVSQMHAAYLKGCAERCRLIDEKHEQLRRLLAATNAVTPEIERLLLEAAQLRAACQKEMLEHFCSVSRTMPAEQGRRYLAWVQEQTILADSHRGMHPAAEHEMTNHGQH